MEVEAEVWYWTPGGMRRQVHPGGYRERYIQLREVERLLEAAHRRGYQEALATAPQPHWP